MHFQLASNVNAVLLVSSNLIDDGAVFYLNGVEAGRVGMPVGPVLYSSLAARTVTDATSFDVITLSSTNLVVGDNLLAVEVHQRASDSSDIVFGCDLRATFFRQVPFPPRLLAPSLTNGISHMVGTGETGYPHVPEISTSLNSWSPLQTNVAAQGQVQFDTPASPARSRFYRLRVTDVE